jgi:iron complex transport system permease protein
MSPPSTATATGRRRAARVIGLLVAGCLAAIVVALLVGSVPIDAGRLLAAVLGERTDAAATIVLDLRLPRALAAFAAGGLLALAGTLMQVLMRNPLADPYVLGISGGAAVAALTAILVGLSAWSGVAALVGALVSTLLVFGLARDRDAGVPWVATRLLLTGVVVAAGWGALIALLLTLAPDAAVRGMLFWLLGDLSAASGGAPAIAARATSTPSPVAKTRRWHSASRCRRSRWPRTFSPPPRPPSRSRSPAASASWDCSRRTRCAWSSATTSACCCLPPRSPEACCWS